MSLKAKLQRMKGHLVQDADKKRQLPSAAGHESVPPVAGEVAETAAIDVPGQAEPDIPHREKWQELQAMPYIWDSEYVMVREVAYPVRHRHGAYAFSQLGEVISAWEASGRQHPLSAAGCQAEDLLFFDTETTGLSGGAGNTVFLLGYSRVESERVVVRQHFLPAPHAEVALYHSFLEQAQKSSHLVTFNGKSFDWPQVKTRHTLIRDQVSALPVFGHLDLLHGARRLWKDELESCRLSLIEQEKLQVVRKDDLPGYLAPIRYFDFLQTQDPAVIEGVLQHNEWDVLSLISLYIHISRLLLTLEQEAASMEERFAIAKWYDSLGDQEAAMAAYRLVADSTHSWSGRAKLALGQLYKKQKNWPMALQVWESCMQQNRLVPEEVYIEAAKLCEHQFRDWEKALFYTKKAYEQWQHRAGLLRRKSRAEALEYEKRISRLEQKLGGSGEEQAGMGSLFL